MKEEISPNDDMILAFARWLRTEANIRDLEMHKEETNKEIDKRMLDAQMMETEARLAVEKILADNGLVQDLLPGEGCDYKIDYALPPETVKIVDEKAVPEKFIETKEVKSVKKKEVLQHFKDLRATNQNLPNWGSIERGARKLRWKLIKK